MERKILNYMNLVDKAKRGEVIFPITCEIDPSNLCNLDCSFCMYKKFRKEDKNTLGLDQYISLIGQLKKLGTKSITFTGGGSPLMNPNFMKMASLAYREGFEIGLITNGVLLEKVTNIGMFKFIRISLDAYDEKSYLKIKGKNFFKKVLYNIEHLVKSKLTDVGISYVICPDNVSGTIIASKIAKELGVDYIQFKPAWINGHRTFIPDSSKFFMEDKSIVTERYIAKDNLPCLIAGLIGIVGADANVYFCCQKRGDKDFLLGSLKEDSFKNIWKKRLDLIPDVSKCPQCRYMNYAKGYEKFSQSKYKFLRHTNFL